MAVFISGSSTFDFKTGKDIPVLAITIDAKPKVILAAGDTLEIRYELEELGIQIVAFKKDDPPQTTWSKWSESIQRWISFQPRRAS